MLFQAPQQIFFSEISAVHKILVRLLERAQNIHEPHSDQTEAAQSEGIEGIHSFGLWFLCNFAKWKPAEHKERCLFVIVLFCLLLKVHTAHGVKAMYTYFDIDSKIFCAGSGKALLKYEE